MREFPFTAATVRVPGVLPKFLQFDDAVDGVLNFISHCETFEPSFILALRDAEESGVGLTVGIEVEI
jgi:hypothetical protein